MPKVSVCIPAYRNGFIHLAIRSVLDQVYSDLEIIIGDDSGGELMETVSSISDGRIRYIANPERLGYSGNHCHLISESKGEFIAFLQHDDIWHRDFLSKTLEIFDLNPSVGLVVTGSNDIDLDGRTLAPRPTRMQGGIQKDPLSELLSGQSMVFLPSATVARATALADDMKPWPNVNIADFAMYTDICLSKWDIFYLEKPLIGYRMHPNQLSASPAIHRDSVVNSWTRYSFSNPVHEKMRRRLLSRAYIARAGALLRNGETKRVRDDLKRSIKEMKSALGARWLLIWILSFNSFLVPLAIKIWTRIHDPVKSRFKGI